MAHDESSFKAEFRDALEKQYGKEAVIWTNNDMFRAGLPDFSAHRMGKLYVMEAKFIRTLPARKTSKVLKHELSGIQADFLQGISRTDGAAMVLVGLEDTAIACGMDAWPRELSNGLPVPTPNLTYGELLEFKENGHVFYKGHRGWQVQGFFEKLRDI